jgi:hypothetical protein
MLAPSFFHCQAIVTDSVPSYEAASSMLTVEVGDGLMTTFPLRLGVVGADGALGVDGVVGVGVVGVGFWPGAVVPPPLKAAVTVFTSLSKPLFVIFTLRFPEADRVIFKDQFRPLPVSVPLVTGELPLTTLMSFAVRPATGALKTKLSAVVLVALFGVTV